MDIKKEDFLKATQIYNKVFHKEVEQDKKKYLKKKERRRHNDLVYK